MLKRLPQIVLLALLAAGPAAAQRIVPADAAQMTLAGSDVSSLASSGYVRVNDEIIAYTGLNATTKIISGLTRAQFGTTATAHDEGDAVQQVKYYSPDNPFDLMQAILTDGGIASGDIYDPYKLHAAQPPASPQPAQPEPKQQKYNNTARLII